ncbi:MAG TPA: hypothetical protein VMR97_09985 [Acidimicrobiales bacterium]|nr:hypothetical protein [Acidimicrobiales bacterium]
MASDEDGKRTTADSAELDRAWSEISQDLSQTDVSVFPAMPVTQGAGAIAYWPDDGWKGFLGVAAKSGARIIYAQRATFDEEEYQEFVGDDEEEPATENEVALKELQGRIGSTFELRLGFSVDGVLHEWHRAAAWWLVAIVEAETSDEDHLESRYGASEKIIGELEKRAEAENWIKALAEDRRYRALVNGRDRRLLVRAFLAERGVDNESDDTTMAMALRRVESTLVHAADEMLRAVVLPQLEAEASENLGAFYEELCRENATWLGSTVKMRETIARRFLRERYGIPMTLVVDMLARYKPPTP